MTGLIRVLVGVQTSVVVCSQQHHRFPCLSPFPYQVDHVARVPMPFHTPAGFPKRPLDVSLYSLVARGAWVTRAEFYLVEHVLIGAPPGKVQ